MSQLVIWALWDIVRLVAAGLVVLGRALLGLAGLAGLRRGRLAWLVATVLAVGWTAGVVGLHATVALATLVWLAWAIHHQRARRRQHVAFRKLTRGLRTPTHAPHATKPRRARRVAAVADALTPPPRLTASQTPEQAITALERYAAAWTHRHTQPVTDPDTSTSDREGR